MSVRVCFHSLWSSLILAAALFSAQVSAQAPTVGDDAYSVNANGLLSVPAATGLLANDTGFSAATHRIERWDARSRYNGVVSVAADGSFTYDPPPGFSGRDDFGYLVRNAFGAGVARVSIEVAGDVVWFVDASAPAGGDGTFGSPLNSFAPLNGTAGVGDVDRVGDTIFVYAGSYGTLAFDLEGQQRLIGQFAGLDLIGSQNDIAPGTMPVLSGSGGLPIVELFGVSPTVRGFRFDVVDARAIGGTNNGNATLADLDIDLSGSNNGAIELINSVGTLTMQNLTIDGSTPVGTAAMLLLNNGAVASLGNVRIGADGFSGGRVLGITGNSGTITFDAASDIVSAATRGLLISSQNATGSVTLAGVQLAGGSAGEPLLQLLNNAPASLVTFSEGVNLVSNAASSHAFSSSGGRMRITGSASVASAANGAALDFDQVELVANATFASLSSTNSAAQGIRIGNPVGANDISVSGTTTITGAASASIAVDDSGSPSGFALDLATLQSSGGSFGIRVLGATVGVANASSSLTTSSGIALYCENAAMNASFATLTSAGAGNALVFDTCSGSVSSSAGSLTSVAGAGNATVVINSSTLSLVYGGTVDKPTAGPAVSINGLNTPGLVTFTGALIAGNASGGVSIANSSRPVTFTTMNLGSAAARFASTPVQLSGNTGTVDLGVARIYTTGATALAIAYANASPGQVVTDPGSLLDVTGAAAALRVSHALAQPLSLQFDSITSPGGGTHGIEIQRGAGVLSVSGLTQLGAKTTAGIGIANSSLVASFREVDVTGAVDGVQLANNTGSFTILGDGNFVNTHTNGAGGTFSNLGDNAFDLTSVTDVRVTDVTVTGTGGHGVTGTGISGTTIFSNVDFSNIGNADNEHVFNFREGAVSGAQVSGSLEINHSVIENFTDNGMYLENFAGMLDLRWTDNVLRNNITTTACGGGNCNGNGILLRADGTSRINALIQNAAFEDIDGIALTANPEGNAGARMDISVVSSAFTAEPFGGPSHTNNGETAISLRNAQGNSVMNFRVFSNDIYNYTGEFALGVVAIEGGDFTTTHGVVSDLYIYNAHEGDAVGVFSDGANTAGSGTTDYDLILSFNNVRTPGGTAGSSFYFSGNGAISGSDANAQITLLNSQFPNSPSKAFWRTVDLTFDSGSPNFSRACFNVANNQVAAGSSGLPAVDLYYVSNTQVRLQGMTGTGDTNAQNRLNSTNTLGSAASVGTLNNITSAVCTTPMLPVAFPF